MSFWRHKLNTKLLHSGKGIYFYKHSKLGYSNAVPLVLASLVLLFLIGCLVNPVEMGGKVYANDEVYKPVTYGDLTLSVALKSGNKDVSAITKQVEAGTPSFQAVTLEVVADNMDGTGKLFVQAAGANSNQLVHTTDTTGTQVINPIEGVVSGADIQENYWGYAITDGTATDKTDAQLAGLSYQAVAGSTDITTAAKEISNNSETQAYTLAFGANIGKDKAAGYYHTNVLISLVAGANEVINQESTLGVTDLDGNKYTYMQELDKAKCDRIADGAEFQLRDKRDNKIYWVAKLGDGLCWMTQNLDLDLTADGLTAALSDMMSDWNANSTSESPSRSTPKSTIMPGELSASTWPSNGSSSDDVAGYNMVLSYDPGALGRTSGLAGTSVSVPSAILTEEWMTPEDVGLDNTWTATTDESFVGVTEYDALNGMKICTKEKGSMVGESDYVPCRVYYYKYLQSDTYLSVNGLSSHFFQGNYYSYNAATAGDGKNQTTRNENVDSSICPKNWKLPLAGTNNSLKADAAIGSFGRMFYDSGITTSNSTYAAKVFLQPFYFVVGGYVRNGSINNANYADYWSATVSSVSNAFYSQVYTGSIIPSTGGSAIIDSGVRFDGMPIRCVAR